MAQSGHFASEFQCPLLGVKQTLHEAGSMSANDPKQTFGPENSQNLGECPLLTRSGRAIKPASQR